MGDDNLSMALGVLYEMIEVDSCHTDDPGASFQRWRFHHLRRHGDLDLPHAPRMMTVASSIKPTAALATWREEHPNRYPTHPFEASHTASHKSIDSSTVGSQKSWVIDNTMWVSSRHECTRPLRRANPIEFHKMQWDPNFGTGGRLLEVKEIHPFASGRHMEPRDEREAYNSVFGETRGNFRGQMRKLRAGRGKGEKKSTTTPKPKKPRQAVEKRPSSSGTPTDDGTEERIRPEMVRQSQVSSSVRVDAVMSAHEFLENEDDELHPLQIPNPTFARKFGVIEEDRELDPHTLFSLSPTAEMCVEKAAVAASHRAALHRVLFELPENFNGPLTPQLWYDGGSDFRW
ncbi:hypothetical protein MKZ38_002019 [Zalerion maritima]|uniref:Uncharacterized protein n=1 Tax=Zalerion maritima TaxID=339359 RepID=A0AAD5RWM1_9PEZI|nr:hypothetical protein MKZ38_002019 [Zalerion maritima]